MRRAKHVMQWLFACLVLIGAYAWAQDSVTYVYTDPQGTPLAEADANGNITATFEYTPYGTYAPQGTSTPGQIPSGPGYTGHVNDPETNLGYMQARYYDSVTGRFLSIDPAPVVPGNIFNINRFDYANNNPINSFDPNGMTSDGDCSAACVVMRRISDWSNGMIRSVSGGDWGSPGRPFSAINNANRTVTIAADEGLRDAATEAAPVADLLPGATMGACAVYVSCGGKDWVLGGLAILPAEGLEADGAMAFVARLHGNSAASKSVTYMYRLTTQGGELLKWGVSSNPSRRYTSSFMEGRIMNIMTYSQSRALDSGA